jgi:hypothetical protein
MGCQQIGINTESTIVKMNKFAIVGVVLLICLVLANAQTITNNSKAFVVTTRFISLNEANGKNYRTTIRVFVANQTPDGLLMFHTSKPSSIADVINESRGDALFTNKITRVRL